MRNLSSQRMDFTVINLSLSAPTHHSLPSFAIWCDTQLDPLNISYSSIRGILDFASREHWCDPPGNSSRITLLFQVLFFDIIIQSRKLADELQPCPEVTVWAALACLHLLAMVCHFQRPVPAHSQPPAMGAPSTDWCQPVETSSSIHRLCVTMVAASSLKRSKSQPGVGGTFLLVLSSFMSVFLQPTDSSCFFVSLFLLRFIYS